MAITELFQDSATISNVEYFLAADSTTQGAGQSTKGMIYCVLEVNNLVDGDIFRLKAWDSISSGGTVGVAMEWNVAHAPGQRLYFTIPMPLFHKWDFSLTRLSANDRSIAWSLRAVT